jgi:acetyl-CoA carboxylase beta subunit
MAILEVSKLGGEMGSVGGVVGEKIVAAIDDRGQQDAEVNDQATDGRGEGMTMRDKDCEGKWQCRNVRYP